VSRASALVYATPGALEQAQRLLPSGTVLENIAREAIERGDLYGGEYAGWIFFDALGLAARFRRKPGYARPRPRAWLITDVQNKDLGVRRGRRVSSFDAGCSRATGAGRYAPRG
jgi:hypothetical protein